MEASLGIGALQKVAQVLFFQWERSLVLREDASLLKINV